MSSDRELGGEALDFRAPDAEDSRAARLRARQIQALTRFTPIALVVNIVNAMLVAHVVLPAGAPLFVALWVLAIAAVTLVGFLAWLSRRNVPPRALKCL